MDSNSYWSSQELNYNYKSDPFYDPNSNGIMPELKQVPLPTEDFTNFDIDDVLKQTLHNLEDLDIPIGPASIGVNASSYGQHPQHNKGHSRKTSGSGIFGFTGENRQLCIPGISPQLLRKTPKTVQMPDLETDRYTDEPPGHYLSSDWDLPLESQILPPSSGVTLLPSSPVKEPESGRPDHYKFPPSDRTSTLDSSEREKDQIYKNHFSVNYLKSLTRMDKHHENGLEPINNQSIGNTGHINNFAREPRYVDDITPLLETNFDSNVEESHIDPNKPLEEQTAEHQGQFFSQKPTQTVQMRSLPVPAPNLVPTSSPIAIPIPANSGTIGQQQNSSPSFKGFMANSSPLRPDIYQTPQHQHHQILGITPDTPDRRPDSGVSWKIVVDGQIDSTDSSPTRKCSTMKTTLPRGHLDYYFVGPNEDRLYTCMYNNCGKLFTRISNIRAHVQTHLCDRPFTCDICGKKFVRNHDLRRHKKKHQDYTQVCPCGKKFSRRDALKTHRERNICIGGFDSDRGVSKSDVGKGRPKKIKQLEAGDIVVAMVNEMDDSPIKQTMKSPKERKQDHVTEQTEEKQQSKQSEDSKNLKLDLYEEKTDVDDKQEFDYLEDDYSFNDLSFRSTQFAY
ncbi:Transcriptional factor [Komagataella phaffii CBS 7435]|uniref:Transcription factor that activates transcription of genes n=2 Tax=Komagataella phaffii TaxID=460519 RepID=C4QV86_KOMPG|nr:uncharacterized protein PAS_chr1-3_0099 [Komagataella phaffii GS115]AOA60342.1 GQ67_02355T0 [Komagataella phaffii]CAH2445813.1 Transcriptional factor [Komagataella phaffii CBS 7435]AOA66624.1 GQ68_02892T0 [Komagataella phaffii GS115]CAY67159.1 Transcription factor that activates transcription of genes [Komagataella phaffii GS115]CCA36268.1 Transcriptional factor [Komagataella phaffii CBS 7435]